MKYSPHPYQIDALKFLVQNCNGGVFLDPGMGKTSITLALITHLRNRGEVNRVLIVVPIRPMYKVWPDEVRKWDDFQHLNVTILHGDYKDRALNEVSDIYLINPEGLKWFNENNGWDKIKADMLIIDESTKFKDYSTARFKILKPQLTRFKRRVILTGEPAPNGYLDLFGQMYIVDRGGCLGQYITHYRSRYFYQTGYGGYTYSLREGADLEIQAAIKPKVIRLAAEDHLDMPELIFDDIFIDLPEDAKRIYKQFEDDFLAQVGEHIILSPHASAVATKCRQVANGGVYDQNEIYHFIHDVKTQALSDLVEQLQGQPLLCFYEFQHDLERIKRVFPNAPNLTGLTGHKLDTAIDNFNAGQAPILVGHPGSAGHGLNLQESCHHVCFYGLTWDLDLYHQAYKRVWRQGQKNNRVFVHRILADRTLDKVVARALRDKDATQTDLLNALKERKLDSQTTR